MMIKFKKTISKLVIFVFIFTIIMAQYGGVFAAGKGASSVKREETQIIVKYKGSNKGEAVRTRIKSKLKLSKLDAKDKHSNIKTELLEIDSKDDISKVVTELKKDPDVEFAQPNYKVYAESDPEDEKFSEQWGLLNNGQVVELQLGTKGVDIKAEEAWETTKGDPSVLIGVLDTGTDINHEDLKDNIYTNSGEIAGNGLDDDGNGYIDDTTGWNFLDGDNSVFKGADEDKHGTHVAGIIAAAANSRGIIGVAPEVKILPLKFIGTDGGYTSDAIDAIEYAKQMGVKIINCSFGGTDYNQALKDEMENSDILFIAAAGNSGSNAAINPVYPACFDLPNLVSVAAADNSGKLALFSNYGSNITVAAPGIGILSTQPDNSYGYMSGTSMAAPYVTGVAALIKSSVSDLTAAQIAARIKNTATELDGLKDKVASNGMVNAYGSLINAKDASDSGTNTGGDTEKTTDKDSMVISLAATVSPKLQEEIHYGEEGINAATGNYSKSFTDMSVNVLGFQLNFTRTYNSKDDSTPTSMGKGWTFGFQGSLKQDTTDTTIWTVKLPNGAAQNFVKNSSTETYTANDSHNALVKQVDGTHILTTKDQYSYGFGTNGYIIWMKDPNGNCLNITVDTSGKVQKITDSAGNEYTITYNSNGLIQTISDPIGRTVNYTYNTNNQLWKVTDPNGSIISTYAYDSLGYLTTISDYYGTATDTLTYDPNTHKVSTYKDVYGNTFSFVYDTMNSITIVTDTNGRVIKQWYDSAMYITKTQDPEGKAASVEYYTDANGFNKLGEEKSFTDRNGNKTQYTRDNNGNITSIINPDNSHSDYTYDSKNNLVTEKDETGKSTYYIYDSQKINIIKMVKPLNGTDVYSDTSDSSGFAITLYKYYSDKEAENLGCKAKGLKKSETDPEGNTTSYEYDTYGNRTKITDPDGNVTQNGYNKIGWNTYTISPRSFRTDYYYDNNNRLEKTVLDNGETTRTVYDPTGKIIQEISPNQYDAAKEESATRTYSDSTVGERNEYYPTGKLKKITDECGNITSYTYDMYGNILNETKANSSIYLYQYDIMNRQKKVSFKKNANGSIEVLDEYSYDILLDGKTTKTEAEYLTASETAVTKYTFDYAGNQITQENPDSTVTSTTYYSNGTVATKTDANGATTYIKYDGLNRLSETWTPADNGLYSYTVTTYYKNDNKKEEKAGKDKIGLYSVPVQDRLIGKTYTYYPDGEQKSVTDSAGAKTVNVYDQDGYIRRQDEYISEDTTNITEFENNQQGNPIIKKVHIKEGDLSGNDINSNKETVLTTTYEYDKNGNLTSQTTPDGVETGYTYDSMNRKTGESTTGLDENGRPVAIKTSTTYDWEGKVLTTTDENANTTTNAYDERGFLIKITDANQGMTAYGYDRAGRKITEVAPQSYDPGKTLNQMDRTEYAYDKMDRLKTKTQVFTEKKIDTATFQWVDSLVSLVYKAYKYDNNGNVIKELNGEGYKNGIGTSADEKINSGFGTENKYDLANRLISALDAVSKEKGLSYTTKYEYDGAGRKTSETDADGAMTVYYYDGADRLYKTAVKKSASSPEQTIKTSTYDLLGNLTSETDAYGNTTEYEYNAFGKVRKTIYPGDSTVQENTVTSQYDEMGNLTKQSDTFGTVDLYTYDKQGRELSHTEEDVDGENAITTAASYDKAGNKRFETDGNGNRKENQYDNLGNLIQTTLTVTATNGTKTTRTTKYEYDKNGNQTTITDWRNNVSTSVYDTFNRIIEKIDPLGKSIEKLEYNASNSQKKSYDALNNKTQYYYDDNNRLIATSDPEGNTTKQDYDNGGNISVKTDGNGNTTEYEYDQFNRLIKILNAKGEETTYIYDLNGNMLTQMDGVGNTIIFEYNAINKPAKRIDAGGRKGSAGKYTYDETKTESYTYYSNGSMATKKDRNGNTTIYKYDIHSRLLTEAIGTEKISYTYDDNNNQLSASDSTGTTTRTYDELNRVTTKSVPGMGSNTYLYDITDGVDEGCYAETTTDPKGNITTKEYDKAGRLITVKGGNSQPVVYEYYDNGSRKNIVYPNGAREEYEYFKNNLLKTLTNKKIDGTVLESYTYTYDGAHNQTSKTDGKGTTSYTYDKLNRLEKVTEPSGKTTEYTFDAAGNRESEIVTEGAKTTTTEYIYNLQNRLLSTLKADTDGKKEKTLYTYDSNGNMTKKATESTREIDPVNPPTAKFWMYIGGQAGDNPNIPQNIKTGTATYEYDVWNQLIKSVTADGTTTSKYNGDGLRVEKNENGKITKFLYEGDKVVLETDGKGKQTARNIEGLNALSRTAGGSTVYYMYNGHADVTALLDSITGAVTATYYYDAFGNILEKTGDADNTITYAGYQYDDDTGLYYLNSRYYDPQTARFMTEDDPQYSNINDPLTLNLYTYCHNEPLMYSDPSGHWSLWGAIVSGAKSFFKDVGNVVKKSIKDPKSIPLTYLNCVKETIISMSPVGAYNKYKGTFDFIKSSNKDKAKTVGYKATETVVTIAAAEIGGKIFSVLKGVKVAGKGVDVELKYKKGWTDAQKAEADVKVKALTKADTVKTAPNRSGTAASTTYKKANGSNAIPKGKDIDHTIDLQLGGADKILNMKPLDSSVNRSLGKQIQNAIKKYPIGTVYNKFKIK